MTTRYIDSQGSPKRLVILDYNGTLDRQTDPITLVRSLVQRGDIVVLWSGNNSAVPRELQEAFTYVISKFSSLKEVVETVREQGHIIGEVVVSDDDHWIAENVRDRGWTYCPPDRLGNL